MTGTSRREIETYYGELSGNIASQWGEDVMASLDDKLHMSEQTSVQTVQGPLNFSNTSVYTFAGPFATLAWRSGTTFDGGFNHAITSDRTWTLPDESGDVALEINRNLELDQCEDCDYWSGVYDATLEDYNTDDAKSYWKIQGTNNAIRMKGSIGVPKAGWTRVRVSMVLWGITSGTVKLYYSIDGGTITELNEWGVSTTTTWRMSDKINVSSDLSVIQFYLRHTTSLTDVRMYKMTLHWSKNA